MQTVYQKRYIQLPKVGHEKKTCFLLNPKSSKIHQQTLSHLQDLTEQETTSAVMKHIFFGAHEVIQAVTNIYP